MTWSLLGSNTFMQHIRVKELRAIEIEKRENFKDNFNHWRIIIFYSEKFAGTKTARFLKEIYDGMLTTFLHLEVTWNTSHKFTGTKTYLMTPFFFHSISRMVKALSKCGSHIISNIKVWNSLLCKQSLGLVIVCMCVVLVQISI